MKARPGASSANTAGAAWRRCSSTLRAAKRAPPKRRSEERQESRQEVGGGEVGRRRVAERDDGFVVFRSSRVDPQKRGRAALESADLAFGGKIGRADEDEVLLSAGAGLGVKCAHIDLVDALLEIVDDVAIGRRESGIGIGLEDEDIGSEEARHR